MSDKLPRRSVDRPYRDLSTFRLWNRQIAILANIVIVAIFASFLEMPSGMNVVNLIRALLVYASIASLIAVISGRLIFSISCATLLMLLAAAISEVKFHFMQVNLDVGDLLFLAPTETLFFIGREPVIGISITIFATLSIACGYLLWRSERRAVPALLSLGAVVVSVAALIGLSSVRQTNRAEHYVNGFHMTSFFVSIPDAKMFIQGARLPYTGQLAQTQTINNDILSASRKMPAESGAQHAPNANVHSANGPPRLPNIIIILHESTIDPGKFKRGSQYQVPAGLFTSADGQQRKLIVETYGGGTWISEYGLLLGVSTQHFGKIKSYLGPALAGKVRDTLPQYLTKLGYRAVGLYPADGSFADTSSFWGSMDLELRDKSATGISFTSPDIDLYKYVVEDLAKRRSGGETRPLFYFIETTATHFPYSYPVQPSRRSSEIVPGDDWAEYSRRLRMSEDDLRQFEALLASRFKAEQFVIAGFGDHQPYLTSAFYSSAAQHEHWSSVDESKHSALYESMFRITGVNVRPKLEAVPNTLEIGFLGTATLAAAGVPLTDEFKSRFDLMKHCQGLLFRCGDQRAVTNFYGRLVGNGDLPGIPLSRLSCSEAAERGLTCLPKR